MTDTNDQKSFRTLRGFLDRHEPDEENYFHFSATLRISGEDLPFDEICQRLGIEPTYSHRKGDRRAPTSPPFQDDAWHLQPSVPETDPLDQHILALWKLIQPHVEYLKLLKRNSSVNVFCGYRSNCDLAGFEVSHEALELFTSLEIPFGVSVIVT
jgi:hypothetical protein